MNPFVADPQWGWWIILYFFLGGLAAGCYFLATLLELVGHVEDEPLARLGYRVAFPLVCVCAVFLTVDLVRPDRFWHMVFQSDAVNNALAAGWPMGGWGDLSHAFMLKVWSPMSIGAQALGLFGLCSFVSFLGTFSPKGRLGRVLASKLVGRAFKVVGSLVGFFIASYTGALLTASNQPLWSDSDWIAPLFLASAASTGISLLLLLGRGISEGTRERLERADLWALGLELFIFLIFLASLGSVLPLALATRDGLLLVFGTLVLGLLLPLWLHLGLKEPGYARASAAALSSLVGGFILRYGIVRVSPALLERYPHLTAADVEAPLWQSWEGKALVALTLVLAVLIPYVLRRQWELSGGQTILSGVVSVLVSAAVIFFSLTPASAQPTFDPISWLRISPEDGRPRGGGVGASAANRPATPFLHSKLKEPGEP
jgi:formate-dependent nitrite reductase membrane component NrfD